MRRLGVLLFLVAAACTEQSTAPGACPNYCPADSIEIHDTLFTDVIRGDSSFRGYLSAFQAEAMTAADLPGIQSRAFVTTDTLLERIAPKTGDTATVAKSFDSLRVRFVVVRRPRNTTNLWLKLYRLPVALDTTTTFADLDSAFSVPPVDSLNVNDLLAQIPFSDTAFKRIWGTIDTVRIDTAGHVLQVAADSSLAVYFRLDSTRAAFSVADTGRSAWGVRVSADSFASVALGTVESGGNAPAVRWFYHYTIPDTASTTPDSVVQNNKLMPDRFDSFVSNQPTAPLDQNLTIGGAPSARSIFRVRMPAFLHDTLDVVRATLILVPVNAVAGAPSDSFRIKAKPVVADLGAKSPLSTNALLYDSTFVHIGTTDTVRLELTSLVRAWSLDTTLVTAFFVGQVPEAASFTEARFYSTRTAAFKPTLQVTYVSRFKFGKP